jgi:hypothetical protein
MRIIVPEWLERPFTKFLERNDGTMHAQIARKPNRHAPFHWNDIGGTNEQSEAFRSNLLIGGLGEER